VFESALTIAVSDPEKFIKSKDAKDIVADSIADSSKALKRSFVNVTELTATAGRRLSVIARRLAGSVNAKFTVTFPAGHSAPVLTNSSMNTTKLVAALQTRAKSSGINITVTGVTVQPIVRTSAGGNTKAPEAATTAGTGSGSTLTSPSMRHFLSIGITTFAFMSLMHGR
jgi:hypothetical protein